MGQWVALMHSGVVKRTAVQENRGRPTPSTREPNWAVLLQHIAAGEQSALAELYDATSTLVFGLALRILGERAAAEDAVVEVYAQVWAQAKAYDPQRGTPLSWLLTLTRSRSIDLLRARHRAQTVQPLETADNVQAMTLDPEETTVAAERHRIVRRALESLSDDQRQAIELAYFSDLSHTEIATKLRQPLGTVKTRIRMGMMRLRELLGPLDPPTTVIDKESTV
jgi:RNA polymerase sigma-70 factor (ECF subfamily)